MQVVGSWSSVQNKTWLICLCTWVYQLLLITLPRLCVIFCQIDWMLSMGQQTSSPKHLKSCAYESGWAGSGITHAAALFESCKQAISALSEWFMLPTQAFFYLLGWGMYRRFHGRFWSCRQCSWTLLEMMRTRQSFRMQCTLLTMRKSLRFQTAAVWVSMWVFFAIPCCLQCQHIPVWYITYMCQA